MQPAQSRMRPFRIGRPPVAAKRSDRNNNTRSHFLMLYDVNIDGKNHRLELNRAEGRWSCRLDGRELEVNPVLVRPDVLSLRIGNSAYEVKSEHLAGDLYV